MLCSRLRCCVTCWGSCLNPTWSTSSLTCCCVLVMGTSTSERYKLFCFKLNMLNLVAPSTVKSHWFKILHYMHQAYIKVFYCKSCKLLLSQTVLCHLVRLRLQMKVSVRWDVAWCLLCVRRRMTALKQWWGIWALTALSWCCRLCWWLWRRSPGEPKQVCCGSVHAFVCWRDRIIVLCFRSSIS